MVNHEELEWIHELIVERADAIAHRSTRLPKVSDMAESEDTHDLARRFREDFIDSKIYGPPKDSKVTDIEIFQWVHNRLVNNYEENENFDYMWRLREAISHLVTLKRSL